MNGGLSSDRRASFQNHGRDGSADQRCGAGRPPRGLPDAVADVRHSLLWISITEIGENLRLLASGHNRVAAGIGYRGFQRDGLAHGCRETLRGLRQSKDHIQGLRGQEPVRGPIFSRDSPEVPLDPAPAGATDIKTLMACEGDPSLN